MRNLFFRSVSRIYFGSNNIFGGLDELNAKSAGKLKQIEESNADAMIVFISDIWLDQHKVDLVVVNLTFNVNHCKN